MSTPPTGSFESFDCTRATCATNIGGECSIGGSQILPQTVCSGTETGSTSTGTGSTSTSGSTGTGSTSTGTGSTTTATHVVKMALSLPMSKASFTTDKQDLFRGSIATVAGVSIADVTIDKIETISGRRRQLAESIRVDTSIKSSSEAGAKNLAQVLTADKMNAELSKAGLPTAAVLEAPKVAKVSDTVAINQPTIKCDSQSACGRACCGKDNPTCINAGVAFTTTANGVNSCSLKGVDCSRCEKQVNVNVGQNANLASSASFFEPAAGLVTVGFVITLGLSV